MKFPILFLALLMIGFSSCNGPTKRSLDIDITEIDLARVEIKRYEKALFSINPDSLQAKLKTIAPEFPAFLSVDLNDTLNIISLHRFVADPLNQKLYDSTLINYPTLDFLEDELTNAFKRFKYYFSDKYIPDVYSYVSGLLYEMPVQFMNDDMIVALDMYLGSQLDDYRKMRIPLYKIQNMNRHHITRDAMYELYFFYFLEKPGKDFLQLMINKGKHLYFLDAMLPKTADHIKIGYPKNKLDWCIANESNIWAFIIENDLLYSSNANVSRKFFVDGPFTSEFSSSSPARMGEWMGWQVVKAYMKNNPDISLRQLFEEPDAQKILKNSGYKPPL